MLIQANRVGLMIIDMQTKLLPVISHREKLIQNNIWLGQLFTDLSLPIVVSEHCVDKIGQTDERILQAIPHAELMQKRAFSAVREGYYQTTQLNQLQQIIISGIEAHVCVLQTAIDFLALGKQVFVVIDAIGSRETADIQAACNRMQQQGIQIITHEMVAFECLESAENPLFSKIIKKYF